MDVGMDMFKRDACLTTQEILFSVNRKRTAQKVPCSKCSSLCVLCRVLQKELSSSPAAYIAVAVTNNWHQSLKIDGPRRRHVAAAEGPWPFTGQGRWQEED